MKEGFFIQCEPEQGPGEESHVVPAPGGLARGTHSSNYYSQHRADGNERSSGPALQKGTVRLTAPLRRWHCSVLKPSQASVALRGCRFFFLSHHTPRATKRGSVLLISCVILTELFNLSEPVPSSTKGD